MLLGCCRIVEFRSLALGGHLPQSTFKEFARFETVAAGVAFGLHRGFACWRDDHFDDSWHGEFSGLQFGFGGEVDALETSRPDGRNVRLGRADA